MHTLSWEMKGHSEGHRPGTRSPKEGSTEPGPGWDLSPGTVLGVLNAGDQAGAKAGFAQRRQEESQGLQLGLGLPSTPHLQGPFVGLAVCCPGYILYRLCPHLRLSCDLASSWSLFLSSVGTPDVPITLSFLPSLSGRALATGCCGVVQADRAQVGW